MAPNTSYVLNIHDYVEQHKVLPEVVLKFDDGFIDCLACGHLGIHWGYMEMLRGPTRAAGAVAGSLQGQAYRILGAVYHVPTGMQLASLRLGNLLRPTRDSLGRRKTLRGYKSAAFSRKRKDI